MFVPAAIITKTPQINAAISQVVAEFYPTIQQIRFKFGQDWTGEWAVYFYVLLSDEANNREDYELGSRILWSLSDKLDIPTLGMLPFVRFRSQTEQMEMNDPAWA